MQNFKKVFTALTFGLIVLTSATIVVPTPKPITPEKIAAISNTIEMAKADGKISKSELRDIATTTKGAKLSLKEKIALKVFGKKIGNKIMDSSKTQGGEKSQVIALILVALIGTLGIHRFYLGYTWQGVVQLLTLGGCGIWALIDLIRIITGDLKPKGGEYNKTL